MTLKIITLMIGFTLFFSCAMPEKKKETNFQMACQSGDLKNKNKLSDSEMSAYAISLPSEINSKTEQSLKDGQLIEAVKLIRGCLDIDLVSTKGIIDRMKIRLNLK